jgi:hypothetical protein
MKRARICPACNAKHENFKFLACNKCRGVTPNKSAQKRLGAYIGFIAGQVLAGYINGRTM